MTLSVDIAIVGAGAAGLAAARTARALGLETLVLEAKDRLGGRAYTAWLGPGLPWDVGAQWLHDATANAFTPFAVENGFRFDKRRRRRLVWRDGAWAGRSWIRRREAYFDAAFDAIDAAGRAGRDVAASEVIPDDPRFRAMFDSWSAALSGAEPDRMSTLDDARYVRGNANWRVEPGVGALIAKFGAGLPVRLSTPVRRIDWGGRRIRLETDAGTLEAGAAIVTVSTSALAGGALAFAPALPAAQSEAIEGAPLGEAEKVALAFDRDVFGLAGPAHLGIARDTPRQMRFQLGAFGRPLATGHFSGRFAAEMAAAGEAAMIDFALTELAAVFGESIRSRLVAGAASGWTRDPHVRGGYSCALPGRADDRFRLAEPIGERLFLAGEACSITAFGALHGAHESGVRAARAAAAVLGAAAAA